MNSLNFLVQTPRGSASFFPEEPWLFPFTGPIHLGVGLYQLGQLIYRKAAHLPQQEVPPLASHRVRWLRSSPHVDGRLLTHVQAIQPQQHIARGLILLIPIIGALFLFLYDRGERLSRARQYEELACSQPPFWAASFYALAAQEYEAAGYSAQAALAWNNAAARRELAGHLWGEQGVHHRAMEAYGTALEEYGRGAAVLYDSTTQDAITRVFREMLVTYELSFGTIMRKTELEFKLADALLRFARQLGRAAMSDQEQFFCNEAITFYKKAAHGFSRLIDDASIDRAQKGCQEAYRRMGRTYRISAWQHPDRREDYEQSAKEAFAMAEIYSDKKLFLDSAAEAMNLSE